MPPSHVQLSREEEQLLIIGVEYYIAARAAARGGLVSVVGILFHHAIEMCLKARLSHNFSFVELSRGRFGHDLDALWQEFKTQFPQANLDEFDRTIQGLHEFWSIRYPDKVIREGAQIHINWVPSCNADRPASPPCYEITVTNIDRLIFKVFEICSRNFPAFVSGMNGYARDALEWENPANANRQG